MVESSCQGMKSLSSSSNMDKLHILHWFDLHSIQHIMILPIIRWHDGAESVIIMVCNDMTLCVVHTTRIEQRASTAETAHDKHYSEHHAGADDYHGPYHQVRIIICYDNRPEHMAALVSIFWSQATIFDA